MVQVSKAIKPRTPDVLGRPAFSSLVDFPESPDLAVIVTPAAAVPGHWVLAEPARTKK